MEISSFLSKSHYLTMSHARSGRQVRRTPSVINNHPGTARPNLPNQITAAPEYAPHLPSHGDGLEEWLIAVEGIVDGKENPLLSARWTHGDSASLHPRLENGVFDFWTTFDNGTAWGFSLNGTLVYSDVRGVKIWGIGNNKPALDGNTGDWSHCIVCQGSSFQSHIHIPSPGTPFTPVMDGEVELLCGQLHNRIEIPRDSICQCHLQKVDLLEYEKALVF